MKPFKPSAKMTLKSFYEVPADVLEDSDEITEWNPYRVRRGQVEEGSGGRVFR